MSFHELLIRFFPPTFLSLRSKHPKMATFPSTVSGYPANTLSDCQSPISTVSPSFSYQIVRQGKAGTPIAVITTMGVFSCLVSL
jgi:hypothetical protein